jgi:magnesium-transporting ATPase (P-type)
MMIKYFLTGFSVKAMTGVDDMMTHVPVISSITRTKRGKFAFSLGIFCAILLAIVAAAFFTSVVKRIPYYRFILAAIIFVLAGIVYSGVLKKKEAEKTEKKINKIKRSKKISNKRFLKLFLTGFVTSFATVIDDSLAYSPALIGSLGETILGITGIIVASVVQIFVMIYFAKKISKIPRRNLISASGLVIIGFLILFGII